MKFRTLAAIDIGSNAIRLMIKNIDNTGESIVYKKVAYLRVPIRLGEDVFGDRRIGKDKAIRLYEALTGFSHILKAYKVNEFMACATSAMRDAVNGEEIIEAVRINSGIEVVIISGLEEAELIQQAGGLNVIPDPLGNYLYVDVGGGSTEIVVHSNRINVEARSFQIGTVRMLLNKVDQKEEEEMKRWLKTTYNRYAPLRIVASGGNINKIFKVLGKREREPLTYTELRILYDSMKEMSVEERILNYKLNPYRADVIEPALRIFTTIAKTCKVSELIVPKVGLVDGIIHYLYNR